MAGKLAVVLSGGGAKGAFQVGALEELIVKRKVDFDIAVGTSTGAIQAAGVAQDDVPKLVSMWRNIKGNGDIYRKRNGKFLAIIGGEPSIYDASPLRRLLAANVDDAKIKATGKSLRLGVVSLTTGQLLPVAENATNIAAYVYASCAMPFTFQPLVDQANEQWVDGGVRDVTPLDSALELNPRGVIVISASPPPQPSERKTYGSLVSIGLRAVEILHSEVSLNDLKNVELINALLTAKDRQEVELARLGITGPNAEKVLRPLRETLSKYRMARILPIYPKADPDYIQTLDFDSTKIGRTIELGAKAVRDNWGAISKFIEA